MTLARQMEALRSSVALTPLAHVAALRLLSEDAFSLLELLSTRPLFLRESQMCHTLFLNEDASIFADAYIASGEDGYYILAEGPGEEKLLAYIKRVIQERMPSSNITLEALSSTHELWGINGPFAWELTSSVLGPPVLGMPYLTLLHTGETICFRGGKTGEYGYDLLIPKGEAASLKARLEEAGKALDLIEISLEALDRGALENWHFCIRTLRRSRWADPLTPLELQLQWRVGYDRDFVGASALRARREEGAKVRATCFCAADEVAPGQSVWLGQEEIGEVLSAGWSFARGEWVGAVLLKNQLAHPGVSAEVETPKGRVQLTTKTAPLLNNLSLHLDPHRHSYQTRATEVFPPLVVVR